MTDKTIFVVKVHTEADSETADSNVVGAYCDKEKAQEKMRSEYKQLVEAYFDVGVCDDDEERYEIFENEDYCSCLDTYDNVTYVRVDITELELL